MLSEVSGKMYDNVARNEKQYSPFLGGLTPFYHQNLIQIPGRSTHLLLGRDSQPTVLNIILTNNLSDHQVDVQFHHELKLLTKTYNILLVRSE